MAPERIFRKRGQNHCVLQQKRSARAISRRRERRDPHRSRSLRTKMSVVNTDFCDVGNTRSQDTPPEPLHQKLLGGLTAQLPTRKRAAAAFLATTEAHAQKAKHIAHQLGKRWCGRAMAEEAEEARAHLRACGVVVQAGAEPRLTVHARKEYEEGPWASDTPTANIFDFPAAAPIETEAHTSQGQNAGHTHTTTLQTAPASTKARSRTYGRITRGLAALDATRLWRRHDTHRKISMTSA